MSNPLAAVFPFLQLTALTATLLLTAAGVFDDAAQTMVYATLVFLLGGLPHGAFDIDRAVRKFRLGRAQLVRFLTLYIAIFITALIGWSIVPAGLLAIFIVTAVIHFSEDWPEVDEPLYRLSLGFAPIAAIALGHPAIVHDIFVQMAGPDAGDAMRIFCFIVAPVVLVISAAGLLTVANSSQWQRPLSFVALIAALLVVPPVAGFALFFCFFHTPGHLASIRHELSDWTISRLLLTGAAISALAITAALVFLTGALAGGLATTAAAFQLLAALALPHQAVGLIEKFVRGSRSAA